jgi:hypothetical protein
MRRLGWGRVVIPRHPSPTASLVLALFHRWEPERVFVIVTVYIDESGTHGSPVTILAGWVGRLGQWTQFDLRWRRLLKHNNLTYFHSKKLVSTKGEFKGWKVSEKQAFMAAAAKAGEKHLEFGFSIILEETDYQEFYIAANRPKEVQLDSRYGLCVRYCLGFIPALARESFGHRDLEIHFVLESGHANFGDADRIFKNIMKSRMPKEQEIVMMLKTLTTGDKIDFPGLQISDIVAYNSFQHVTRRPFPTVELTPDDTESYMAEAKSRQRVPILHLRLGAPVLKRFKQFIFDEIEEKKERRRKASSPSLRTQPS